MTVATEIEELAIDTSGYRTHGWRCGAGNPNTLLLLHGGGPGAAALSNWEPTLRMLGSVHDVIAPDLLGFGETEHPDPPLWGPKAWLAARCEQLVALLDELDIARADLVGNSLGGALALQMAFEHPGRVQRLVLMGSGGAPFTPGPELLRMLTFYSDSTVENLRAILANFVYDLDGFEGVEGIVEARHAAASREEVARSFDAMFHTEDGKPIGEIAMPEERIRELAMPALVVHGREDKIVPVANSHWLFERLPNAELHLFGACGHWAMLEHPKAFARVVDEFLQRRTEGEQ